MGLSCPQARIVPDTIERSPDGEEILEDQDETERIRVNGTVVSRTLRRKRKIVDDDLPKIAEAYREFLQQYGVPGA